MSSSTAHRELEEKENPQIPCNPALHSATVLELQGFSLNSFQVGREKKGGKEGGWEKKKKKIPALR